MFSNEKDPADVHPHESARSTQREGKSRKAGNEKVATYTKKVKAAREGMGFRAATNISRYVSPRSPGPRAVGFA